MGPPPKSGMGWALNGAGCRQSEKVMQDLEGQEAHVNSLVHPRAKIYTQPLVLNGHVILNPPQHTDAHTHSLLPSLS